jgi:hypothetical protein
MNEENMLNIGKDSVKTSGSFELVIQVKDSKGNPTGKTKSIVSNRGSDLLAFYNKFNIKPKKRKKVAPAAQTDSQIKKALEEVDNFTNEARKNNNLED